MARVKLKQYCTMLGLTRENGNVYDISWNRTMLEDSFPKKESTSMLFLSISFFIFRL